MIIFGKNLMGFKLVVKVAVFFFLGGALICQSKRQVKAKGKEIEFLNVFLMMNIDFFPDSFLDLLQARYGFNPSRGKANLATVLS